MTVERQIYNHNRAELEIVVNTWNRLDLAAQTLDSLRSSAVGTIRIVVVDDDSQLQLDRSLVDEMVVIQHCGAAMARKWAMEDAQRRSGPDHVLFVDSDLVFAAAYDVKTAELIREAESQEQWTLASPYRSTYHLDGDTPLKPGFVLGATFGGATLGLHRSRIGRLLAKMPTEWDRLYDWVLCDQFRAVKPAKSLADHVGGQRADAVNPGSWDCGVNFYC